MRQPIRSSKQMSQTYSTRTYESPCSSIGSLAPQRLRGLSSSTLVRASPQCSSRLIWKNVLNDMGPALFYLPLRPMLMRVREEYESQGVEVYAYLDDIAITDEGGTHVVGIPVGTDEIAIESAMGIVRDKRAESIAQMLPRIRRNKRPTSQALDAWCSERRMSSD